MAYTPHTWTTNETITADKLNNIEQALASNGGGDGFDLILYIDSTASGGFSVNNVEIVKGNILECEQKVSDGETVNGILIGRGSWSYTPSGVNSPYTCMIANLNYWCCPYTYLSFSSIWPNGAGVSPQVRLDIFTITYDPSDGSLLEINNPYRIFT